MRQNAALRAAMRISPKEHRGTEYLCRKAGMPTMLQPVWLKLYVFSRQTRAATSGEIRQETEYASFVKQSAILFILMPDCVKGAASKLSAKISIAKETTYITQEVNMHVQSDKRSAPNEGVLVIF
jgi:hypothetical protein